MNDFDSDFELELHESRPAPRGELLDSLVSKVSTRPAPVRKSKWQPRLAGAMAAAALLALAGLGGVSVASNAIVQASVGGGGEPDEGGPPTEPVGDKTVAVCLNGSSTVVYFTSKNAVRLVEIQARAVYATPGDPPSCEAP